MRMTRAIFIAGSVVVALGLGAAAASAVPAEISFEASGVAVPAGTTFEAVASSVKLQDYGTGNTFAVCATATAVGQVVRSPDPELEVAGLTFSGCNAGILGPFSVGPLGLPWRFGASSPAGSSGFPGQMSNWTTASATISLALGCTTSYTVSTAPTGFFVQNTSGGSRLRAVKAGPFNKTAGGCSLVAVMGLTADARISKVNGAAVAAATNFWAS